MLFLLYKVDNTSLMAIALFLVGHLGHLDHLTCTVGETRVTIKAARVVAKPASQLG